MNSTMQDILRNEYWPQEIEGQTVVVCDVDGLVLSAADILCPC